MKKLISLAMPLLLFSSISLAQQTAMLEWVNRTGGTGIDRAVDIAVDAAGNICIA